MINNKFKIFSLVLLSLPLTSCSNLETLGNSASEAVTSPISNSENILLQSDVKYTNISLTQFLISNPTAPLSDFIPMPSSKNAIIKIIGNSEDYQIIGKNISTGYVYQYDSSSGVFSGS